MAEQRVSEGKLVTLEGVAAASNIAAGQPVVLSGSMIYTWGSAVTGFGATSLPGYHFVGMLDEAVSAGQSPISVWVEGVFKFPRVSTGSVDANLYAGNPVWWSSGVLCQPAEETGDMCIGTIVGMATYGSTAAAWSGTTLVRIRPGAFNWTIYCPAVTATQACAGGWPALKH